MGFFCCRYLLQNCSNSWRTRPRCKNLALNNSSLLKHSLGRFSTNSALFGKRRKNLQNLKKTSETDDYFESIHSDDAEDVKYERLLNASPASYLAHKTEATSSVGVVVLQPWVKWGRNRRRDTSKDLLLQEACALIDTLPNFQIRCKKIIPLLTLRSKAIFGSGTMEVIKKIIWDTSASVMFVNMEQLKKSQVRLLEKECQVKVVDRYLVVLAIFHHHARTPEACLQIALAELPFMRSWYHDDNERMVVANHEKKLRQAVTDLESHRKLIRSARTQSHLPSVAVVGYTNSGKTTLIRALTGDSRLKGKNQLFATLDVTVHGGSLPCGLPLVYVDTVGFIQDIPTSLLASFKSTLEDAVLADLVIHVCDISHPDFNLQRETVIETLRSLRLPDSVPLLTVHNKCDLVEQHQLPDREDGGNGGISISALTGYGLSALLAHLQENMLRILDKIPYTFYVPTGSPVISWLRKTVGMVEEEILQENPQKTKIVTYMSEREIALFKKQFSLRL